MHHPFSDWTYPLSLRGFRRSAVLNLTRTLGTSSCFSNICDGELYQDIVFTAAVGYSLTLNADDTPLLFQQHLNLAYTIISYKGAYHATNELVLAALQFGKKKPDIDLFLDAFMETMTDSSQNDLVVEQNPSRRDFSCRHLQTVRSINHTV